MNVTLDLRSYSDEALEHQHDYHQLVLPVMGGMEMSVSGSHQLLQGSYAAVVPAGAQHGCFADTDNRFVVADIPSDLAPALARLPEFIELDPALTHYVSFLHQQIINGEGGSKASQTSQRQMLLLLIQLLQEGYGETDALDKRIQRAKQYLDDHYAKPVTLVELAAFANISPRQLSELFRRQLSMTPQQYLIEKRMQQAWQLLEQEPLSVQQVADRVGYATVAAFSDRFRKHFGRSPSELKRVSRR